MEKRKNKKLILKKIFIIIPFLILLLPSIVKSQELIWSWEGESKNHELGYSLDALGDINGDGFDDVIVGVPGYYCDGCPNTGKVYVYSGINGNILWAWTGEVEGEGFGYSVSSAGDVNGDKINDVIIGDPYYGLVEGKVYVYSGLTGDLLGSVEGTQILEFFGYSVSSAGDVNNDGLDDILVGAPYYDGSEGTNIGKVYVFSVLSKKILLSWNGEKNNDYFGNSVSGAGDVNNDGFADVIIGAPSYSQYVGKVYVYSGFNGELLKSFEGESPFDFFGTSVSQAGDVNGDGFDDVIIGAVGYEEYSGKSYVYAGNTGNLLFSFVGEAPSDMFGTSVTAAGDINNDGFDDVIIGAYAHDGIGPGDVNGKVYIYSGFNGQLLLSLDGEGEGDLFGIAVSGGGDINRDTFNDIIIGAPGHSLLNNSIFYKSPYRGKAYVYSLSDIN